MSVRLKQTSLAALTGFLALNVWTGAPLIALWLGSRVQGEGPPSMAAVAIVVVSLIVICIGLYQALKLTSRAYDDVAGHAPSVRTHAPWLRSMRDEREVAEVTPIERIVVLMVILAAATFNVWFFFFSGSSIGSG
jgi:predicted secreted protein